MRGYVFASTHNKQQHALGLVAAVLRWRFTIRNACECMRVYVCVPRIRRKTQIRPETIRRSTHKHQANAFSK